jgi:hypothetical protein
VDIAKGSDSFILCDAFAQGTIGCRVPEQLGSYDDIATGSVCKLLVLLFFWVAFIILDEVDNGGAPVGVEG